MELLHVAATMPVNADSSSITTSRSATVASKVLPSLHFGVLGSAVNMSFLR